MYSQTSSQNWLLRAGAAKVVGKMASQFAIVTDEKTLAVTEPAVPENTRTATKFGLAGFTDAVLS